MRSFIIRITAVAVAVLLAIGFLAAPPAEAQEYSPQIIVAGPLGGVTDAQLLAQIALIQSCTVIAAPTISHSHVGSPETVTITFSGNYDACVASVNAQYNPTVYTGPVPANRKVTFEVPACHGDLTVTVTGTLQGALGGGNTVHRLLIPAAAACSAPVAASVAFTGSDVSLPLAAGFSLIGAGGLVLLGARKRRDAI